MLVGPEPDYRWRAFTADIVELARPLRRRPVDQPGRDPGRRPAHPAGPDHRHRGRTRPVAWRGHRRTGGHVARPVGARLGARDRGRGGGHPGARLLRPGPALRVGAVRDGGRSSCCARSGRTSAPRSRRTSWPRSRASCAPGSTRRPAWTRRRAATSSGSSRCTTSSACRRATTSSRTSSGSCAIRVPRAAARRAACRTRGIVDGPPLRQVCRLRRRPASRRRVDAPPVDGLDVRRSVRDDQTIGRGGPRRTCHPSRNGMDGCPVGVRNANARRRIDGRVSGGADASQLDYDRGAPQSQCEAPHDLRPECPGSIRARSPTAAAWAARGGLAIGGGGIGLVLFLAYILLGGDPSSLGPILEPGAVTGPGSTASSRPTARPAQDANTARRLPDPRLRQQHPGVLDRDVRGVRQPVPAGRHVLFSRRDLERVRHRRVRPRARSTARPISSSISTSTSSRSCARGSAPRAARWPRAT